MDTSPLLPTFPLSLSVFPSVLFSSISFIFLVLTRSHLSRVHPHPQKKGGWHVAHYVICPLDQSTGGARFFSGVKKNSLKEKREKVFGEPEERVREKENDLALPPYRYGCNQPIAIRKEAFFIGAARSAGLYDKN